MSNGFSFPYGVPLVVYPLLVLAHGAAAGKWWGWLVLAALVVLAAVFTWEGLSRRQYETIHAKYPDLNRATWIANWLLFFAAPGWILALLGGARTVAG